MILGVDFERCQIFIAAFFSGKVRKSDNAAALENFSIIMPSKILQINNVGDVCLKLN